MADRAFLALFRQFRLAARAARRTVVGGHRPPGTTCLNALERLQQPQRADFLLESEAPARQTALMVVKRERRHTGMIGMME